MSTMFEDTGFCSIVEFEILKFKDGGFTVSPRMTGYSLKMDRVDRCTFFSLTVESDFCVL